MRWLWLGGLGCLIAGCGAVRVPPGSPDIYRVGSFSSDQRFLWSASRFSLRFEGEGPVRVRLRQTTRPPSAEGAPQPLRMRVELDDAVWELYADARGQLVFETVVAGGEHRITLIRQSEALVGEGQLMGLELPKGARVLPWAPRRLIELIGDSLTVGFGNEGVGPCRFSSDTQAITSAFPWRVGEALQADVRVVGWSGHGVTRNWGDRPEPVMPEQWTAAQPQPELVLVMLGANDFWNGDPGPRFMPAYLAFLERIRSAYPRAAVYSIATGPRRALLREAGLTVIELEAPDQLGCVGHPSAKSHAAMAEAIVERLCRDGFCGAPP